MYNYEAFGEFAVIFSEKRIKRPRDLPPNFCPFCPGHEHLAPPAVYELRDGDSWIIRVVPNKYPAVSHSNPLAYGHHEVVIECPDHGKTFWLHDVDHIAEIIRAWGERERKLYEDEKIKYVSVFKNWGKRAGASIPHGHSQIIATDFVPPRVERKTKKPFERTGFVVREGDYWDVVVPSTPRFAYEVHVLPKGDVPHIYALSDSQRKELAYLLKILTGAVTKVVDAYNFFVFTSPKDGHIPVHVELYPRKNTHAGFELGGGAYIVPVSPETALEYYKSAFI